MGNKYIEIKNTRQVKCLLWIWNERVNKKKNLCVTKIIYKVKCLHFFLFSCKTSCSGVKNLVELYTHIMPLNIPNWTSTNIYVGRTFVYIIYHVNCSWSLWISFDLTAAAQKISFRKVGLQSITRSFRSDILLKLILLITPPYHQKYSDFPTSGAKSRV